MTKTILSLLLLSSIIAGESANRSDFLPSVYTDNIRSVAIDAGFGGSLIVTLNAESKTIYYISIGRNGKVLGNRILADQKYIDAIMTVHRKVALMTKEEKSREGFDGYTIEVQNSVGKTNLWCPTDVEVISALRTLCVMASVPHRYVESDGVVQFYPGEYP